MALSVIIALSLGAVIALVSYIVWLRRHLLKMTQTLASTTIGKLDYEEVLPYRNKGGDNLPQTINIDSASDSHRTYEVPQQPVSHHSPYVANILD